MMRTFLSATLAGACLAVLAAQAAAQTTQTYSGAGTTTTPGAWLTPTNWTGFAYPGASQASGGGSATDIALFNNSAAAVGIDMGAAGGTLTLGAISYQYSTAQVLQNTTVFSSFAIGNSSASTPGVLQLNGATVNGMANTLLAVSNVSGDVNGVGNNGNDLTIGNTVTGGTSTLSIKLGTTNGVFNVFGDTHSTRSIFINVPITQAAANSGFTVQGGGNVTLSGSVANSFTGPVTIAGGQLQVTNTNGLRATAATSGTTTVQSGGTLYLNAGFTTAENISIAGTGYTQTLTSTSYVQTSLQTSLYDSYTLGTPTFAPVGALRLGGAGVTLNGTVTLAGAGALIYGDGGTSTVNGVIGAAGSQTLEKSGEGTLTLTNANTYTGGTTITEGQISLTGNGSLASQSITLNNSGTLTLTNTAAANSTTRLGASTAINLNSGIFNFASDGSAANFSQSVGTLTLGNLPGIVTTSQAAAGQTSNLRFASLSPRTSTGSAIFLGVGLGTNNQNTITFGTAPTLDQGGLIGAYALYGTTTTPSDFASYVSTAATSSTPGGVVAATANTDTTGATWTAASNLKFTGGGTISAVTGGSFTGQVNSLNVQTTAAIVDLSSLGSTPLTIGSGGILAPAGVTIQNGSLVAGQTPNTNSELLVSIPAGTSTISANIMDNGSGKTALTVQGAGTLVLSGLNNTFSGPITVNGSTLQLNGTGGGFGLLGPLGNTTSITLHQVASTLGSSTLTLNGSTIPSTVTLNLESLLTGGVTGGLSSGAGGGPGIGATGTTIGLNNRTTINATGTGNAINGPIVLSGNNIINVQGTNLTLGDPANPSTISAGPNGFTGALTFRSSSTSFVVNDTINLPNAVVAFLGQSSPTTVTLAINSTGNNWAVTDVVSGNLLLTSNNNLPTNAVLALGQYGSNGNGNTNLSLNGFSQVFGKGIVNPTTNINAVIYNGAPGLSVLTYNSPGVSSVIISQVDDVLTAVSPTSPLSVVVQAGSLTLDRPNGTPYSGGNLVTGGTLLANGGSSSSSNPATGTGPVVVAPASISVPTVFGGIGGVGGTTAGPASGTFANVPSALDGVTGVRLGAGVIFAPGIASINNGNPTTAVYVSPGTPPGATVATNTLAVKSYVNITGGAAGTGGTSTQWIVGVNTGATGNTGGGTIANAANLLNVYGTGTNSDSSVNGQLSFFTTASNKINIDVEAVNSPVFTPGAVVDYVMATTTATGNIFLNGSAFPTTPDSTDFTFSSSSITNFAGLSPALLANPANTSQLLLQFTIAATPPNTWTWTGTTSGSWSVTTNWSPATVPTSNPNTQLTFGATAHGAMTNDIAGTFVLNSLTFNASSPVYTLAGNGLNFEANGTGVLPQIVSNSANLVTIGTAVTLTNNLTVNGTGNVTLSGVVGGAGALTMSGTGTLTLGNASNTNSGGINIVNGNVQVSADAALGTGAITIGAFGRLTYSGTTATTRSFNETGGTIAVAAGQTATFNGSQVSGVFLVGPGTFATNATNGAQFANVTADASVAITSNSAKDQFLHVTNSGAFSVPAGVNTGGASTTVNLNGFTNEGLGTVTIGAGSEINVGSFQSYGNMTITPATGSQTTLVTNLGNSAMGFNGGSQTFLGTPATAPGPTGPYFDGIDLHGHNLVLTGGLFVNNGFTVDSTGSSSIIVGYGALYKGAGTNFVPIVTQNGGKFSAGNSPGLSLNGSLVIGPGGTQTFDWQINDAGLSSTHPTAPGVAGPSGDSNGNVSGWSLIASEKITSPVPPHNVSSGNMNWTATATPGNQFDFQLETLLGPTTPVGTTTDGAMSDFDMTKSFVWPFVAWQGTYTGPTDTATLTADTLIDTSAFANAIAPGATFLVEFNGNSTVINGTTFAGSLNLVYQVPEPGTMALVGLAGAGLTWYRRRRAAK